MHFRALRCKVMALIILELMLIKGVYKTSSLLTENTIHINYKVQSVYVV
jgi:hypothetical protein